MNQAELAQKNKKLVIKLVFVLIGMVGFTFALVPLYDVLCRTFGINGKTGDITFEQSLTYQVDDSRVLDLSFLGTVAGGLPISFKPLTHELPKIHTGEFYTINYEVKNLSNKPVVARAIPSVMPA